MSSRRRQRRTGDRHDLVVRDHVDGRLVGGPVGQPETNEGTRPGPADGEGDGPNAMLTH